MLEISSVRSLGSVPVSALQPAGMSPRDGINFEAMQNQLNRLTDLQAPAIEWPVVTQLAATVLKDEGKDLTVGIWLTLALFHQHSLSGLADGIHVLRELVQTYWNEMSPPVSRLRGRRNQMQWLLDLLTDALDEQFIMQMPAMPFAKHEQMLEDWDALDTAWQQHDQEAPAFYALAAVFRRLLVEQLPDQKPATESQTKDPAEPVPPATRETGPATATSTSMPLVRTAPASIPGSIADAATAVENALGGLHPLITWLLQEQPTAVMLFRLNRICAWTALEQLPPAQGVTTRLPAPAGQLLATFEQIVQAGDPQAIIRFSEARLASLPYWLDLGRASHAALTQLGASQAAEALAQETAHFMGRLPGLSTLAFNDGQPFADPATRAWLDALQAASGTSKDTAPAQDEVNALVREAESQAVAGKLADALTLIQSTLCHADGGRTSFRFRLAQCQLIHRFDMKTDMRPLVAPLIEELETHRLSFWEPELARQALELAADIELRRGIDGVAPAAPMLGRLSHVDVKAAWQLSQSTAD